MESAAASEEGRAGAGDIPRDRSGAGRAGFRLPLPQRDEEDLLAVVVEAAAEDEVLGTPPAMAGD